MGTIPLYILVPAGSVLLVVVAALVYMGLREGREISFWPPRIGPRPPVAGAVSAGANAGTQAAGTAPAALGKDPNATAVAAAGYPPAVEVPRILLSAEVIALLEIISGPDRGQHLLLTEGHRSVTFGRGEHCDVRLGDVIASQSHFRLRITPVQGPSARRFDISLLDMGSSNGTFVNGASVREQTLEPGDVIQVGATRIAFHRIRS
jgi:hypothetical protein